MRNARAILSILAVLGILAGCTTTTVWERGGTNAKKAAADLKECADGAGLLWDEKGFEGEKPLAYSSQGTYFTRAGKPFEKCMTGKGYTKVKK